MVKGPYLKDEQQEIHPILNLVFRVDQLALMTETRDGDISHGLAAADTRKSRLLACCRHASSCSRTHGIAGLSTAALALNTTEFAGAQ